MEINNLFEINADDYALSDDILFGATQKLKAAFSDTGEADKGLKIYAVNVLIGNVPAKKVSESVGVEFNLRGFYVKNVVFKDSGKAGRYVTLFGRNGNVPCSYFSASEKVLDALMKILYVYGAPSNWGDGIPVRIRMNTNDGINAYSLEAV